VAETLALLSGRCVDWVGWMGSTSLPAKEAFEEFPIAFALVYRVASHVSI
jgi:hypothetical protein